MKRRLIEFTIFSIILLFFPLYLNAEEGSENSNSDVSHESVESRSNDSVEDALLDEEKASDTESSTAESKESDLKQTDQIGNDNSSDTTTGSTNKDIDSEENSTYDQDSMETDEKEDEASENLKSKTEQASEVDAEPNKDVEGKKEEEVEEKEFMNQPKANSSSIQPLSSSNFPYSYGDQHPQIIEIKQMLNTIGFDGISETDYFGNWTETRVEQFQSNYGLSISGQVDEKTFNKLKEVYNSPFQVSNSSSEIPAFKEKLNSMGFDRIAISENYGNWTATRVKHLQGFLGLKQNGIADEFTRQQLEQLAKNGYQKGDRNFTISDMKEKLNAIGFDRIAVTDYYGNWTATRVKQFQENYNLNPTGTANKETLDKLNEVYHSPFQKGKRHNETIELKEMLNSIGYGYITVTNYFGSFTETQVKRFQSDYGLKNNGIADQVTRQKIKEIYDSILKPGDRDSRLIDVKEKLNSLGFDNISVTDYFGSWTETRVKQFQEFANLNVTGTIDQDTLIALDNLASNGYSIGDSHWTISEMKEKLNAVGFNRIAVTDYYGNWTQTRVRQFQEYYDLPATGKANKATLDKLNEIYNHPNQQGSTNDLFVEMKQRLNWLGYDNISETDYFGGWTTTRLKQFQDDYGLPVNGIAEENTLEMLESTFDATFQQGSRHDKIITMKQYLNKLGFDNIAETNYFGNWTETRLKQAQSYYGIDDTGKANLETLELLKQNANSPYQLGKSHPNTEELKRNLNSLDFGRISVTELYGNFTETQVTRFQSYYGLRVNGIADQRTLAKIKELLSSPHQKDGTHPDNEVYKRELNDLGFGYITVTPYFGNFSDQKLREFQNYYGLRETGIVDRPTQDKLNEIKNYPIQQGKSHSNVKELKRMLNDLGYGYITVTDFFGNFMDQKMREFQRDHNLPVSGIAEPNTVSILRQVYEASRANVREYDVTFDRMVDLQMRHGNPKYDGAGNISADEANVRYYMNPANFPEGTPAYLQFMLLDESANVSATELNEKYLKGKGMLENTGQAFIEAGERYDLNEFYLMEHALHETGNGGSTLALGVGVDRNGKIIRDSKGNIIRNKNHKDVYEVVYNFYGYGAHDENPLVGGVNYGFERGWFTPEAAVIGGAENISNNYISQGQNTLYKMKWDPDHVEDTNRYGKQYATHIMWAVTQAQRMFNRLGSAVFDSLAKFEVPQFKDQPEADSSRPPSPEPQLPPAKVESYYSAGTLGETTANVNFREGPSTDYTVILTIENGSEIELIGDNGGNWIKAIHNGEEGWLHSDYVTITFEPVDVVTSYPEGTIATVERSVNFRKGPSSLKYESYGFLSSGTSLDVLGDNGANWIKVKHDGRIGWVHSGYVNMNNLYQVHASDGGNVNYRTEPNGNEAGTPVASLSSGTFVALSLDSNGDIVTKRAKAGNTEYNWVRIKVNGNNYWMADDFLRKY